MANYKVGELVEICCVYIGIVLEVQKKHTIILTLLDEDGEVNKFSESLIRKISE